MKFKLMIIMISMFVVISNLGLAYDFVADDDIVSEEIVIKDMIVQEDYLYNPFTTCGRSEEYGSYYLNNFSTDNCNTVTQVSNVDNITVEKHTVIDIFAEKNIKYHCFGYAYSKEIEDDILKSNLKVRELPVNSELKVYNRPKLNYTLKTIEGEKEFIDVACFQSDYKDHTLYFNLTTTFNKSDDVLGYNSYNQLLAKEDVSVFLGHIDYQNYHKYLTNRYYEESDENYNDIGDFFVASSILIMILVLLTAIQVGLDKIKDLGDIV